MIINALEKSIQIKIVYFGPALSGKTTSLKTLFDHFGAKDKVESIESTVGRTLFFDYGTINFQKEIWLLKIHVYSTTGQDFYAVTRPATLNGVDGIVFVVDSHKTAYVRNQLSWQELNDYFQEDLIKFPILIAFNKQDLMNKFPKSEFLRDIKFNNYKNIASRNTIALSGEGVLDSFEEILSLVFNRLYNSELILA